MPPARYSDWVRRPLLRKMIGFDRRYSGLSVYSGKDCDVVAGREGSQQGRFCIVSGSETGRLDGVLLRVFPIVVSTDLGSLSIK